MAEPKSIRPMRKRIRYLFLPLLVALAGCEPEDIPTAFGVESSGQEVVNITFSVMGFDDPDTKASASGVTDDEVDRIDIFAFDENGWIHGHTVIGEYGGSALDLSQTVFTDSGLPSEWRNYLIIANLDPDSAQYIGYLDKVDIARYPEGFIPWSAGNCRVNRPLMVATAKARFGVKTSVSAELMRYCAKFEIGTVSAEFWGSPDLYRNVYVQHIAFVNCWDLIRICQAAPNNFTATPQDIFGPQASPGTDAFGSPSSYYYMANTFMTMSGWSEHGLTYASMDGTYNQGTWGGKGKLKQDYNYMYNNNTNQPKNTINLTCPESLQVVSQHTWDTNAYLPQNAGKLCSDIDGYLGPLTVNRVFYTLPTKYNVWYDEPLYGTTSQNREQRLVLGVKINGTLYFYSKMIKGLSPNMCYMIRNITLKGEPSEYANAWVRGGQVTKAADFESDEVVSRTHGNVVEIDNLVL